MVRLLTVEAERADPAPVKGDAVGVDLGIAVFATLSDTTEIAAPQPLKRSLHRLRRKSRALSRTKPGSRRRRKAAEALARLHRRVRNQREDMLHKLTTKLARSKSVIVVEDLAVKNLVRNHRLARAISDMGWGRFRQMLAYKTVWYGSRLIVADRYYPSSKHCSGCKTMKAELSLSERTFRCEA